MANGALSNLFRGNKEIEGRAFQRARLVLGARSALPENKEEAASHSLGLQSCQGFATCNDQELLFAIQLASLLTVITKRQVNELLAEDADVVGILLEDNTLNNLLFEVVVAALKRSNIVYLPFYEGDQDANVAYSLFERAQEVMPKSINEPLPNFELRFVGYPMSPK